MNAVQQQPVDASTPALLLNELQDRCLGRSDLVEKVLGDFQAFFATQLSELDSAMADADLALVQSLAHRLKGAALTIAAHRISQCASRLETCSAAGDNREIATCLAELKGESSRLELAIQQCRTER